MSAESTCRRCDGPTAIKTRQANFCQPCFITFIQQKQRKAMEGCKVLFARPGCVLPPAIKILVPISFGQSSLALLDMAHAQLEEQAKTYENAAGFTLNAVFIDCSEADPLEKEPNQIISELEKRFAHAKFTCIPLSKAFEGASSVTLKHNREITPRSCPVYPRNPPLCSSCFRVSAQNLLEKTSFLCSNAISSLKKLRSKMNPFLQP
jgi:cytoplasmic tRNA 2-thiolation protein 2